MTNITGRLKKYRKLAEDVQYEHTETSESIRVGDMYFKSEITNTIPDVSGMTRIPCTDSSTSVYMDIPDDLDSYQPAKFIIIEDPKPGSSSGDNKKPKVIKIDIPKFPPDDEGEDKEPIKEVAEKASENITLLEKELNQLKKLLNEEFLLGETIIVGEQLKELNDNHAFLKQVGKSFSGIGILMDLWEYEGHQIERNKLLLISANYCLLNKCLCMMPLLAEYNTYLAFKGSMIVLSVLELLGIISGVGIVASITVGTSVNAVNYWWSSRLKSRVSQLNGRCAKNEKCKCDHGSGGIAGFILNIFRKDNEIEPSLDPSGYVYEAVPSNRLEGVTATCYEKVTKYDIYDEPYEEIQLWDASSYGQQNPLITNGEGCYAWDVPQGLWQVRYEKEGYETGASEWMEVPPPRFDVNIGLLSYEEPVLEEVFAYPEEVVLSFSKYIKVDTMTGENVHIMLSGEEIAGTLEPLDGEASPADGAMLASQFAFVPDRKLAAGEAVTVEASTGICTYAGVFPYKKLTASVNVILKPEELEVTQRLVLDYDGEGILEIAASPAEAVAGMEVSVSNNSTMILEVQEDKVTLDSQGKATVHVKALLPGECVVGFALSGSKLNAQSIVSVENMSDMGGSGEEKKISIDDGSYAVILSNTDYTYNGRKCEPTVTVKGISVTLREGTDYTVIYRDNINAGTATAIITGIGSYTGTLEKNFIINKAETTITASDVTKTASGKAKTFFLKVKCSRECSLAYSSKDKRVKVSQSGKVTVPKDLVGETEIAITAGASQNYKEASKKVTLKVNPAGVKLINVKGTPSGKLTVKWKKNKKVGGYEIQYSTSKKFAKSVTKTKRVKKATRTKETISKLKKGKVYYVRIRTYKKVSGRIYCSGWSAKKKVKVKK